MYITQLLTKTVAQPQHFMFLPSSDALFNSPSSSTVHEGAEGHPHHLAAHDIPRWLLHCVLPHHWASCCPQWLPEWPQGPHQSVGWQQLHRGVVQSPGKLEGGSWGMECSEFLRQLYSAAKRVCITYLQRKNWFTETLWEIFKEKSLTKVFVINVSCKSWLNLRQF